MSDRTVIFASTDRLEHKGFDLDRGEIVSKSFVPYDDAKGMGIEVVPMPKNFVLWESKGDGKTKDKDNKKGKSSVKYLHELGDFVVAVVDDDGKIRNEFIGRNFRRPVPIDFSTLKALKQVFVNGASK